MLSSNRFKQIYRFIWSVLLVFGLAGSVQAQSGNSDFYETGMIEVDDTRLHYERIGHGEPIVILHGGPGEDHNYLVLPLAHLADEYRLIFYDQRYMGESDPNIDTTKISTEVYVEDLEAIRKYFELEKMNLLGNSWGGMLAMQYAIQYQDHLNSMILLSPMGGSSDFFQPFKRVKQQRWRRKDSLDWAKLKQTEAYQNRDTGALTKASKIKYRTYFHHPENAKKLNFNYGPNTLKNGSTINSYIIPEYYDYDIHQALEKVEAPTLILHGKSDPILPKYIKQLHQALPNSKLIQYEEAGHMLFIVKKAEMLKATRSFLRKELEK